MERSTPSPAPISRIFSNGTDDKRNSLSDLVENDVRSYFGDKVYKTKIPRNVRVSEAPSHGKPVLVYDTACVGSRAYIDLAKEVIFNQ